jgi:predicted dehydrogenase
MSIEGGRVEETPRPIRLGMVGGGEGAFIGAVHRIAARLDGHYALVAGALSASPEKARRSGAALGLAPDRSYGTFVEMARAEAARPDGIEAVAIVTPNHIHTPAATAFLEAGVHVICDKPLATSLAEARGLQELAIARQRIFAVTYNYTGYPLVRHARALIADGALGEIRVIQVEYCQDWLTEPLEGTGQKQAAWRTDPAQAGRGGCLGDIGTHAYHLAGFVTGMQPTELAADLATFVAGRRLDDNVHVMLRYASGARGMLWASQVAPGNENNLRLRVYGTKGGIEWRQEQPNELRRSPFGRTIEIVTRAAPAVGLAGQRATRIPAGHPEGYLEAFATIYTEVAAAIRGEADPAITFPGIEDGIAGVAFIEAAVRSSEKASAWVKL